MGADVKRFSLAVACSAVMAMLFATPQASAHRLPPAFVQGARCIQSHEGSWRDSGGPYYGGMQMDYGFMRTYGTWLLRNVGTADKWTPAQQLRVSYRAYRGWKGYPARYWSPWPNTARLCGLA